MSVRDSRLVSGIDLVYRRTENGLKGDFIVGAGADPGRIRVRFTAGRFACR